jgi:hypothetical protein
MRSRRLSFVAGWAALTLLAIAGFAAFGAPEPPDDPGAEAEARSLGHTAGAYAGLSFALPPGEGATAVVMAKEADPATEESVDESTTAEEDTSVSTSPPTMGWLSEVQVRELVSKYFQPTDVNRAVRIAWCESRFDPGHADLRTGGVGLFNHLPGYWDERASNAGFPGIPATDPEASTAAAAWEVYNGAGWDVFNCR